MVNFSTIVTPGVSSPLSALAEASESTPSKEAPTSVRLSGKAMATPEQAQAAAPAQGSGEPETVKQMKQLIKDLQKRLAEEQKQLAQIQAQPMDPSSKQAALAGKQTSIASISAALMTATTQLLEALNSAGGSTAGSMLSTRA
ncbi:hypothetical protein [Pseudomonas cremoricolorata]|uniref:Chemotaxis protein n=1 Tax=Pseudomonas cremoricolorata TaxID=157783 RepID=A0A089WRI4_9PSED|nr:hypothetical protein [Pseudomonas cremoricolorata]AIR91191.1 hypothetical protein LK03_18795 [Pseudomonas cremoricolorata]